LREAAKRKFAHRERCRLRISLHACGGAGEKDGAKTFRQHALNCLLRDQKAAERAHADGANDLGWDEIGKRSTRPPARIVNHHVRRPDLALDSVEKV
jgi:hypothetical protein